MHAWGLVHQYRVHLVCILLLHDALVPLSLAIESRTKANKQANTHGQLHAYTRMNTLTRPRPFSTCDSGDHVVRRLYRSEEGLHSSVRMTKMRAKYCCALCTYIIVLGHCLCVYVCVWCVCMYTRMHICTVHAHMHRTFSARRL